MTDGIDWVRRWRELVEGREAQAERARGGQVMRTAGGYWDQRAAGFRQGVAGRTGETDEVLAVMERFLTPDTTVLDVGAGVGRYAVPLTQRVKQVTAVEPSSGMREFMSQDAAAAGVKNLEVVAESWEDATVQPVDVVLCSHVVYFIADIRAFLDKVAAHARGYVFMAIRTNQRDAALRELWGLVHQEPRVPEPGLMDLYPALHQVLGVCANVQVVTYGGGRNPLGAFDSVEDALPEVRRQVLIDEGSSEERAALDYLRERMVRDDRKLVLPGPSVSNAVVWWDNRVGSKNLVG